MAVRDRGAASISARCPSAKPGHLRAQASFIDEDESRWIEVELAIEPVATTLQEVGALLLQCMCGLFLNVQPRVRSQTSGALRPIETALPSRNRRTISLRVMSFASSIMPTMKSSCASRREPPRRPCFAGVNRPAHALAIQAMAVEMPIPNRATAERADIPSRDAAKTRLRRSSPKARVILPPTKSPVGAMESEFFQQGNPQANSAFNGRAIISCDEMAYASIMKLEFHFQLIGL